MAGPGQPIGVGTTAPVIEPQCPAVITQSGAISVPVQPPAPAIEMFAT